MEWQGWSALDFLQGEDVAAVLDEVAGEGVSQCVDGLASSSTLLGTERTLLALVSLTLIAASRRPAVFSSPWSTSVPDSYCVCLPACPTRY
ncbi:hypothetical protein PSEUDO8Z_90111 [Pseudomonas sp. 8Z]|nr:hypothetical protein PSEUDO8Z_90111 [Pseudomonas sp. 8Z]